MLTAIPWVLTLALGAPAPSPADPPGDIVLAWEAPTECPDHTEVRRRIDALLTNDRPAATTVHVEGRITAGQHARWRMELLVRTDEGSTSRTVEDERCEALADAAALVVAVAVDPQLESAVQPEPPEELPPAAVPPQARAEPEPDPLPTPGPVATRAIEPTSEPNDPGPVPTAEPGTATELPPPADRDRPAPSARKTRPRPRFGFRVAGLVDSTPLPAVAWGIGGSLALFGRFWRTELGGAYWFGRQATLEDTMASGSIALWALRAGGYGVPTVGPVEFPLGIALEAGALEGRGTGATIDPQEERQPWVALLAEAQVLWSPLRMFSLGAAVTAVVPLIHSGFVIGDQLLFRVDPVGVRGHAFLEVRTP